VLPRDVILRGKTSFVGGVSDGEVGVAAMHLREGQLEARKAWFCFDDMIVCLGAGITCPTDNSIYTSINQCFLRGPVRLGDAKQPPVNGAGKYPWVWHDSVGYIFPAGTAVHVSDRPQSGAWSDIGVGSSQRITKGVFSLWVDHGAKPSNAAYQYILMPGADENATVAVAKDLPIQVLSNTASRQAVWHKKANVLGIVFSEPGEFSTPTPRARPRWTGAWRSSRTRTWTSACRRSRRAWTRAISWWPRAPSRSSRASTPRATSSR
jgi:chondroitin AC lyase